MHRTVTFDAVVTDPPEQTVRDGDHGIVFAVTTSRDDPRAGRQVFVSRRQAAQVDNVSLAPGASLRVEGEFLEDGVVAAQTLSSAPEPVLLGDSLGSVDIHVPALSRLGNRERRYNVILRASLVGIVALGGVGLIVTSSVDGVDFLLFLLLGVWFVWHDLHFRKVDRRQYGALAQTVTERLREELGVPVSEETVLELLGAGLEQTGNTGMATRYCTPGPIVWSSDIDASRYRATINPIPLQPDTLATITVTQLQQEQ